MPAVDKSRKTGKNEVIETPFFFHFFL